ncbi:hypothetical protein [Mycobacterium sp.]|jgi:hypothetical protein|uniref:hypothetical protein n=1 Tax=Mycobacterium sp. TaxID=1785 RepID=UPI002D45EFDF|nr:hypothetical protein [Mycobacterium sp.]HZA09917.1 hypothetical protein [Mycobacterium sp.]
MRTALTLAAAGLAACGAVLASAGTASADGNAQRTIADWENQGYTVNIDRVGSGPLDQCTVTSVRNPNTITRFERVDGRGPGPSVLVPIVVSRTVQVSLYCAG